MDLPSLLRLETSEVSDLAFRVLLMPFSLQVGITPAIRSSELETYSVAISVNKRYHKCRFRYLVPSSEPLSCLIERPPIAGHGLL